MTEYNRVREQMQQQFYVTLENAKCKWWIRDKTLTSDCDCSDDAILYFFEIILN